MYEITPIEAAEVKNINLRHPHKIEIRFLYFPHTGGRKYNLYLRVKKHVETQIQWMVVLSTDELFRIKEAINKGLVPKFFEDIVNEIYTIKQKGEFVNDVLIGDNQSKFPIFTYKDKTKYDNPLVPKNVAFTSKTSGLYIPKPKVTIPRIPQSAMNFIKDNK